MKTKKNVYLKDSIKSAEMAYIIRAVQELDYI